MLRLEETSWDRVIQFPCSSSISWGRLSRKVSSQVFNTQMETPQPLQETYHAVWPPSQWKKTKSKQLPRRCFLVFRWNSLCFNLCTLPLVLSMNTTDKSLAPSSSFLLNRHFYTPIRSHLSLLFSKLKNFSCLSLSSYQRCSIKNGLEHLVCRVHFLVWLSTEL